MQSKRCQLVHENPKRSWYPGSSTQLVGADDGVDDDGWPVDGTEDGRAEGARVGWLDGLPDGFTVGTLVGRAEGANVDGKSDGVAVGTLVG